MNKSEFEKKFLETIKEKMLLKTRCEYALRDYLRFIDDHKIYEYKPYDQLLAVVREIRIRDNETDYLNKKNYYGAFSPSTFLLTLRPNPSPSTFVHELTHALSSRRRVLFDCDIFKKQTAPEITSGVYLQYHDFSSPSLEINPQEEAAVVRWLQRNSYLFADTKISRPTKMGFFSGFERYWREFSEFVNTRKINSKIKTTLDERKFHFGQLDNDFCFDSVDDETNNFEGLTEGVTELIAKIILSYSSPDGLVATYGGYTSQTMLAAQLYAIFGESLFEGYFTNSISPLAKNIDLSEEKLASILKKVSTITISSDETLSEQNMQIVNEIQVDIIKLFERKMLRELAKYKDDFQSSLDMRSAIISAFFDYSKVLHFGIVIEELVNPNFNDVWEQLDRSIKNCVEFGNKLLARRQKTLMNKINPKTLGVFKNQNYLHYDYVGKNMREITLSNRLAQFDFNFEGPSDECRANATKKQLKIAQIPGEIMFAINNGADQTALYLYVLGEDVDKELIKTDFERESEQNNKE